MQKSWSTIWPTLASVIIMSVILSGIWLIGEAEDARYLEGRQKETLQDLNEHRALMLNGLNSTMLLPTGLAAYISEHGDISQKEFRGMAKALFAQSKGLLAIELARDNVISHIYPMKGNEKALGLDLMKLPQADSLRLAQKSHSSVIYGPRDLIQGGTAFISETPVFVTMAAGEKKFWGTAIALLDRDALLAESNLSSGHSHLAYVLYRSGADNRPQAFMGDAKVLARNPVRVNIDFLQDTWTLAAVPKEGWQSIHSPNRPAILVLGILLAAIAAFLFWHLLKAPLRLGEKAEQAASKLRDSEARFTAISESVPVPVIITRLQDGLILYANTAATSFLGSDPVGATSAKFFDTAEERERFIAHLTEKGPVNGHELQIRKGNGDYAWVSLFSRPFRTEKGDAIITTFMDISERIRTRRILERMNEELEKRVEERTDELTAANRLLKQEMQDRIRAQESQKQLHDQLLQAQKMESVGIMAGGIAHDFNNLLVSIMGNAELATLETGLPQSADTFLQRVLKAAARGKELVSQLLAYSGKGKLLSQSFDLSDLAAEMARLLKTVISKKATLQIDLTREPLTIHGDPNQVRQVIMNLITNASDALENNNGSIRLRTGRLFVDRKDLNGLYFHEGMKEGEYLFVEVSDDGCGMDQKAMQKIFDPFYTSKFSGTGLGLSALLGIVKSHHGGVFIASQPGKGTTFRVLFPEAPDEAPVPALPIAEAEPDLAEIAGTVLVIDDELDVRKVAKHMLEKNGLQVLLAEDGVKGMEMFAEYGADISLVLLDRTMPNMDGETVFRELRKIRADIPILLVSGYTDTAPVAELLAQKPAGYLHKPYAYGDLIKHVKELLQNDS